MRPTTPRQHGATRLAIGALVGLGVAAVLAAAAVCSLAAARPENIDDAFIVFVYVRHFIEGGGFFWNSSQGHVDGFTSFLDVVVKAGAAGVLGGVIRAAFWTTLLFQVLVPLAGAAFGLWLSARCGEERWPRLTGGAILGGLVLATSPALAHGSSFLLETPLYCCLLIASVTLWDDASTSRAAGPWLAIVAFALTLARPEGLPVAMILTASVVWNTRSAPRRVRWLPPALLAALTGAYLTWRIRYFGYWAPNTYYAKSSATRWFEIVDGVRYVAAYLGTFAGALLGAAFLVGVTLVGSRRWRRGWRRRAVLVWLLVLCSGGSVIVSGGDCYPGARFLAGPIVLVILGLMVSCYGLEGRRRMLPLLVLAILGSYQSAALAARRLAIGEQLRAWPLDERWFRCDREFAEALSADLPADAVVAESDFQRLKYFEDRRTVIDLSGLNDRRIAHRSEPGPVRFGKFSHDVSAQVDAAIWIWGYRVRTPRPMSENAMWDLLHDEELRNRFSGYNQSEQPSATTGKRMLERYRPASFAACNSYYNFLVRRDVAPFLVGKSFSVGGVSDDDVSLTFGLGATRPMLREGFGDDEQLGDESWVWSTAKRSRLVISMSAVDRPYRMTLIGASIGAEGGGPILTTVLVNHLPVGQLSIAKTHGRYTLTLPPGTLREGDNEIEFTYPRVYRAPSDPRLLAVRFERLELRPCIDCPE